MFRKLLVLGVTIGLSPAGPASAQSATDSQSTIDQVIVVGARIPLPSNQTGNATTIIDRTQIERRQVRYVTDLLRSVPGFSISRTGVAGSQTQVRVRGAEANHVLVLIDGVRANDPASGDEFRWEHLTTGNIERIEIVRGPQSALWGSDAIAAVVNIITRTAGHGSSLDTYVEAGSNQTGNFGISGSANSSHWSLRGGLEHLQTNGSNIAREGSENDGADVTTVSAAARFRATESMSLNIQLRALNAFSQFDPVDFIATGLPVDGDLATQTDNFQVSLGGRFKYRGGRLTNIVRASYFESDNQNLANGVQNSSTAADRVSFSFQSDIDMGDNRLSLALEHERTRFEQRGEISFGDPNQNQRMDVTSAIAEFQLLAPERLSWILSGRFDDNSDFDDAINGRLSVAYRLSNTMKLRGTLGTGRKNPTFTERFGFFPGQFIGNPELEPERSVSWDIGLDYDLLDGEFSGQVTLFRQDLQNEINGFVFDPVTFLSTAENIDGKSQRSGIELAAQWQVNERFGLGAAYTYTDSTERNLDGENIRELRRPKHAGSVAANFQSMEERLHAVLTLDYDGAREDIFFPPFPALSEIVTLKRYWLLDLTVQYQLTPALGIFVKGTNLLDQNYEQVYGYQTSGREGYVGLRAGFGQ